jgi:hypothetical protein
MLLYCTQLNTLPTPSLAGFHFSWHLAAALKMSGEKIKKEKNGN